MSTDLRAQLQSTLGTTYSIERELGGGGMSRVFVARDETLGRDVVVKIVSPENVEGMSRGMLALYTTPLATELPRSPRTDAVWRRLNLNPDSLAKRVAAIPR